MSRILKTGKPAQDRRIKELSNASIATKPRKAMISMEDLRTNLVELNDGQRTTLLSMSDNEFRGWFDVLLAAIEPHIKASDGIKFLIADAKNDIVTLPLDKGARIYFVNVLYQTIAYRRSGIEIFVQDKEVSA